MAAQNTDVGSRPWITKERATVSQLLEQDIEDVAYAVRGEMDWLNDHMDSLFKGNILYVAAPWSWGYGHLLTGDTATLWNL